VILAADFCHLLILGRRKALLVVARSARPSCVEGSTTDDPPQEMAGSVYNEPRHKESQAFEKEAEELVEHFSDCQRERRGGHLFEEQSATR
jgi:hypothetical protein